MENAGLYIHVPFCRRRCSYCGFYSTTATELIPRFLAALRTEMHFYREKFHSFDSIYIGGGTPSLLSTADLAALLEAAAFTFEISTGAEITLEANPADLDRPYLQALRGLGINRLNIGVQALDDTILQALGRRHDRRQAILAMETAREAGFTNLGLDLIYGAPGQDINKWMETLELALSFKPDHLSCYQLTIEPHTALACRLREGEFSLSGDEILADFFFRTSAVLRESGYLHYEISNFARSEDAFSRHNQKYWHHAPYLGLGPSAHSFLGNMRWWNFRDLHAYLREVSRGISPQAARESLTGDQLLLEAWFLALRTRQGIDIRDFQRRYDFDIMTQKQAELKILQEKGLLELAHGFLRPTVAGMAVADSLALV